MIRLNDIHAIKLIAMAAKIQFVPKLHSCIARYSASDKLMGGVLYTDFWGGSVSMHWAGFCPNWVSRALIWLSFDYPFRQLNAKKVIGLTPESNVTARNTAIRFGFRIEYLVQDVFNDADGLNGMYILSLRREDCKWLDMPVPVIEFAPPALTSTFDARINQEPPSEMRH